MDDEVTVITADYMYLVILSTYDKVSKIIHELDKNKKNVKYLTININYPCANIPRSRLYKIFENIDVRKNESEKEKELDNDMKYVLYREGVETAQALTYAEGYDKSLYMIVEVEADKENYKIGFPRLNLEEEIEPEKMIGNWIKESGLSRTMNKVSIKPVNIVGNENEILVFSAKVCEIN